MNIHIDTEEIAKSLNSLKGESESFTLEINNLIKQTEQVKEIWQMGEDKDKFINLIFDRVIPELKQLNKIIDEQNLFLESSKNKYIELDNEFAAKNIEI